MTLDLATVLRSAGIADSDVLAIRHAFVSVHEDGSKGIHADSTDAEVLAYTANQLVDPRSFPALPPPLWVVFLREGGDRARLWSVVANGGEISNDGLLREFALTETDVLADLRGRLVIQRRGAGSCAGRLPPPIPWSRSRMRNRFLSRASTR